MFAVELYGLCVILCECLFLQRSANRGWFTIELSYLCVILGESVSAAVTQEGLVSVELYGLCVILCECLFLQQSANGGWFAVDLYGLCVILCVCFSSGRPTGAVLLLNSMGSV